MTVMDDAYISASRDQFLHRLAIHLASLFAPDHSN
jgi:hypothetical protein